jgi:hypothetical protein
MRHFEPEPISGAYDINIYGLHCKVTIDCADSVDEVEIVEVEDTDEAIDYLCRAGLAADDNPPETDAEILALAEKMLKDHTTIGKRTFAFSEPELLDAVCSQHNL